jgi:hypothetical protein
MPAENEDFPWRSYYGNYNFFEDRMKQHSSIKKLNRLNRLGDGLYEIQKMNGDTLRTFICECYSYGVAEYIETKDNHGEIDAVVINSLWCEYTMEAKHFCFDEEVGLFVIADFMAAINQDDHWRYLTEEQSEYFEDNGWL